MLNRITDTKSAVIASAEAAAMSNPDNLTCDRIEALTGGHGMLNIAVQNVIDVVTEELLKGKTLKVEFANTRKIDLEETIRKAVNAAKLAGADGANAALIVAAVLYMAGTNAQAGIPAGNRKLGAMARMIAGVDRSGVSAIPTSKMNSKISGFPAVLAVYEALAKGELTEIDGYKVPMGGALYGHSTLGEDIVWPQLAENGARVGTEAMLKAMAGAGIQPNKFTAALFGSAAILEIIHPDAEVPDGQGTYGRTTSVALVGRSAVKAVGLPEKLHMRVTGEEFDTGALIGDLGLILKDIGGPSVIGMMAFNEIISSFAEGIAGASCTPSNPPLGHIAGYSFVAMKALFAFDGDVEKTKQAVIADRIAGSFDPSVALMNINLIARKANSVYNGPITRLLIDATQPELAYAIHSRAEYAYEELSNGRTVGEIVHELENDRLETTQNNAAKMFSAMMGKDVSIKITRLEAQARRTDKLTKKYWSFDPLVDAVVKCGDNEAELKGVVHELIPALAKGEHEDIRWAVNLVAPVAGTLAVAGCSIINAVIPAAVACAMGKGEIKDIAAEAEKAAFVSAGIPGTKASAVKVGTLAVNIVKNMLK